MKFSDQQIDLLRRVILKGASETDVQHFVHVCEKTRLDPFARQIYGTLRGGKLTITVSIDGFRLVAQRTGEYAGQSGPHWCAEDGVWKDVWLSTKPPAAARVGVRRAGFVDPLFAVARWGSYAQGGNMWSKMPDLMLGKCAEALALRRAFPAELSGLYSSEEMEQAGVEHPDESAEVHVSYKAPLPMAPEGGNGRELELPKEAPFDHVKGLLADLPNCVTGELLKHWADAVLDVDQAKRRPLQEAFQAHCEKLGIKPGPASREGRMVKAAKQEEAL